MAYLTAKLPRNDCLWTPRDGSLFHRSTSWVPLLWGALRLLPPMLDHHRYFDNGSTILVKQIAWDVFRWRRENCDQHRSLVWSDRPKDQVSLISHISHFFTHAKFLENKIYTKIHSKLLCINVYYCVLHSKYTVNCQFFALNLWKITPGNFFLHRHRLWCLWQIWGRLHMYKL